MQVDPVEERSGYTTQVFVNKCRRTDAFFLGVIVVSAGTGVHRSDQHKAGRVIDRELCPGYGNLSFFQGLPHNLKHGALKLRQFVQKKYAVMRKGDFSRLRIGSTADHGGIADGVVRRAERPDGHERLGSRQLSGNGVDLSSLERLSHAQGRQNGGQPLGKHGFPGTGRPDQDDVMATRSGNFEGSLYI